MFGLQRVPYINLTELRELKRLLPSPIGAFMILRGFLLLHPVEWTADLYQVSILTLFPDVGLDRLAFIYKDSTEPCSQRFRSQVKI